MNKHQLWQGMIPKEAPWKTSALSKQPFRAVRLVPLRLERSESAASLEHSSS